MAALDPIGFWSYARDDEAASGNARLTKLHGLVSGALKSHVGRAKVDIFRDTYAIKKGDEWQGKIFAAIDRANFLIPIITPGFLESEWCLKEVRRFLDIEKQRDRGGLIFPILFTEYLEPKDSPRASLVDAQAVLDILKTREWSDFSQYRIVGFDSPDAALLIDTLAKAINNALLRPSQAEQRAVQAETSATRRLAEEAAESTPAGPVVADVPTEAPAPAPPKPPAPNGWMRWAGFGAGLGLTLAVGSAALPPMQTQSTQLAEAIRGREAATQALRSATSTHETQLAALDRQRGDAETRAAAAARAKELADRALKDAIDANKTQVEALGKRRDDAEAKAAAATKDKDTAERALQAATANYNQQRAILERERDEARDKLTKAETALKAANDGSAKAAAVLPIPQQSLLPGNTFREPGCAQCPELIVIPAGIYIRGSENEGPYAEPGHNSDERPAGQVKIASFMLGRFEVTEAEFAAFADDPKRTYKNLGKEWRRGPAYAKHPVVNVSWRDAKAYVAWLNIQAKAEVYSLPTEAQWEYAARARTTLVPRRTEFSTGATIEPTQAVYNWKYNYLTANIRAAGPSETAPVGSTGYKNDFGLSDMHGNAWEWVADCYKDNYEGAPTDGRAVTDCADDAYRVLRGGAWLNYPRGLRSAFRHWGQPSVRAPWAGVRVARTL